MITEFKWLSQDETVEEASATADQVETNPKQILIDFLQASGLPTDIDNLVSLTVEHNIDQRNGTRTVVRSWDTLELATGWVAAVNAAETEWGYPGKVVSIVINPE
jgi:hypothetical protein